MVKEFFRNLKKVWRWRKKCLEV